MQGRDSVTECVWIEEESHVEVRQSFNTEPGKRNEVLNIVRERFFQHSMPTIYYQLDINGCLDTNHLCIYPVW